MYRSANGSASKLIGAGKPDIFPVILWMIQPYLEPFDPSIHGHDGYQDTRRKLTEMDPVCIVLFRKKNQGHHPAHILLP